MMAFQSPYNYALLFTIKYVVYLLFYTFIIFFSIADKIYEGTDVQKDASNISLKSSKAQSFKIMWTIPEYFSLPDTSGYSLNSPSFDFGNATWFLKLYPNGNKLNSDSIISLNRSQSLLSSCHDILYAFDIIVENEKYYQNDYSKYVFKENIELEDAFPKRSILYEDRNHIAPDGDATYWCHIFFEESAENDAMVRNMLHELHGCKSIFIFYFLNIYLNSSRLRGCKVPVFIRQ